MTSRPEQSGRHTADALLDARILRARDEVRAAQRALDGTGKRTAELAAAATELELLRRE